MFQILEKVIKTTFLDEQPKYDKHLLKFLLRKILMWNLYNNIKRHFVFSLNLSKIWIKFNKFMWNKNIFKWTVPLLASRIVHCCRISDKIYWGRSQLWGHHFFKFLNVLLTIIVQCTFLSVVCFAGVHASKISTLLYCTVHYRTVLYNIV